MELLTQGDGVVLRPHCLLTKSREAAYYQGSVTPQAPEMIKDSEILPVLMPSSSQTRRPSKQASKCRSTVRMNLLLSTSWALAWPQASRHLCLARSRG